MLLFRCISLQTHYFKCINIVNIFTDDRIRYTQGEKNNEQINTTNSYVKQHSFNYSYHYIVRN